MPINPRVFFDFDVDGQRIGRVIFELFADEVPKTAENFRALCTGELGLGKISNMPLHYRGSIFHRIIKGFCVQGGDFTRRNGSGGESIYGATFPDESFARKHTTEGLLSMANRGPNTQSSQFFITTRPTPHLDGKHVVFGRVVHGYDIIQRVEKEAVDERSKPLSTVMVANSGELELRLPQAKAPVSQEPSRKRSRSSSVSSDRSRSLSVSASSSDSEDERRRRRRRHHKKHKKSSSKKDKKKNKKKSSSRKHRRRSPSVDSYASDASQRSRSRSRSLSPVTDRREQEQQDVPAGSSSPSMDNVDRIKSSASSHHSRSPSPHHRNRASSRSVSPRSKYHDDHDSRKGRRSYRDDYDDLEDDEKPDWERQRRFPDDPEVQFKGRGRKKYRPSGGGMRAW